MITTRRHHIASPRAAVACVALTMTASVLGSVVLLFGSAGAAPWLPAEDATLIAHCDSQRAPAQRRACIQTAVASRSVSAPGAIPG